MTFYEELLRALEEKHIQYLIVGGVAVVLHGYVRATADLDLMLAMNSNNLNAFLGIMKQRGYKPKPPVPLEDFADPEKRRTWIQEKSLTVFSVYHPGKPQELIDIFVDEPIPFAEAYEQRKIVKLETTSINVISIRDLIGLKKRAGRPQDIQDIQALESLQKGNPNG